MISYAAFYDELEKIAGQERYADKETIKRHLKTVAATGIGTGLGTVTGLALEKAIRKPRFAKKIPKSALPILLAIGGGLTGLASSRHRRRVDKYIKEGK